jgi:hypothetical protein
MVAAPKSERPDSVTHVRAMKASPMSAERAVLRGTAAFLLICAVAAIALFALGSRELFTWSWPLLSGALALLPPLPLHRFDFVQLPKDVVRVIRSTVEHEISTAMEGQQQHK